MPEIKVSILLEHHEGEKMWTVHVPLAEGCLAEAPSPEGARQAIIPELVYHVQRDPQLLQKLKNPPEFKLTTIDFEIPEQ